VLERGDELSAVEIKAARTPSGKLFSALDRFAETIGKAGEKRIVDRFVVYGGSESQERSRGRILAWREIDGVGWTRI
jgi:hypothetical protein